MSIVQGFAFTLFIGVAVSMFSAIIVTRAFLRAVLGGRAAINPTLFGMPAVRQRLEPAGVQG